MKISFVLPTVGMSGGIKVVAIYAKMLADKGHEVVLVSPPPKQLSFFRKVKSLLKGRGWPKVNVEASHLDGLGLNHIVLETYRPATDKDFPDADVIIASWWETAEWVNALSQTKGAKVYFIQHHEVFDFLPIERAAATYRLPLHKIVIAKWLLDVMKNTYGDHTVDIVPNSVDRLQFHAEQREKQSAPTVGFLFAYADFKGVDVTLAAIKKLKESMPNLRVISFGSFPPDNFPQWDDAIEFQLSPAQDKIKALYAQCDVWITASRTEGFNLPAMEAMACRTPIVSTKAGWPMESIISYENGVLTDVNDVTAIADGAKWILSLSQDGWKQLSKNAYETLADSSWEHSAMLFENALHHAISRQSEREI
ncbi:MAG: glycosyltransferase family 4 protein [Methylotenera sp.]|uniref:glycosyltransferase family 4 protein n=1 Tax=Methylotenera sp. TaxID=2051956 RepID=UPI00272FD989|nr:glycosyltransferase family 4 protein [Methylotenera sp.]MDP1524034.1 glycosyltransferase family 4 protein [Methylotenera sp.]